MTEAREKTIAVLRGYVKGEILPRNLLSQFPDHDEQDSLLDDIINLFSEPLDPYCAISSWRGIAEICIKAIEEDWSSDRLYQAIERGIEL